MSEWKRLGIRSCFWFVQLFVYLSVTDLITIHSLEPVLLVSTLLMYLHKLGTLIAELKNLFAYSCWEKIHPLSPYYALCVDFKNFVLWVLSLTQMFNVFTSYASYLPSFIMGLFWMLNYRLRFAMVYLRPVVPGCAGCAMAHPDFGRSVNPISTMGDRLCPPNYYWHTQIFRPSDGH